MSYEQPKISTQDEARLIFEAARAGIGSAPVVEVASPDPLASSEASNHPATRGHPHEGSQRARVSVTSPAKDRRLEGASTPEAETAPALVRQPAKLLPAPSTSSSAETNSQPCSSAPVVSSDPRLSESPREALRRLQRKADEARSIGIVE